MSIDETLMCSFHILKPAVAMESLSPINDRRPTGLMGGAGARRPATPMPPPAPDSSLEFLWQHRPRVVAQGTYKACSST